MVVAVAGAGDTDIRGTRLSTVRASTVIRTMLVTRCLAIPRSLTGMVLLGVELRDMRLLPPGAAMDLPLLMPRPIQMATRIIAAETAGHRISPTGSIV